MNENKSAGPLATAMLALIGIVAIPLWLALWAALSALAAANVALIAAPLAVLADWALYGYGYPAKMYASLAATGVGMLAALGTVAAFKTGIRLTAGALDWTNRIRKGRAI
ncbi:HAAS domain-containing protein [Cohnella sp. JJ-181]|uniref:HAAS domain-containing protein n=1 Tax=Cohnella rhizoplanae TaxID=2974897 RepID=UPI0022FFBF6F|nr:DUF1700 domain-containing protein [Cohnella sp. JJ-181]CAI6081734.1 hypothetical protein COHCIP112018_03409 [Cohnella sp. JJ-181]